MRHLNLKIAGAVALALAGSSAYALNPAQTVAANIVVHIAGASAQAAAIEAVLTPSATSLCSNTLNDYNRYRLTTASAPDMRAYSCTIKTHAQDPDNVINDSIEGKTLYVTYRLEGGSVYGPGSIAKNRKVKGIQVNSSCVQGSGVEYICTASGYSIDGDTITGTGQANVTAWTTDMGLSDVEPEMFTGENWPGFNANGTPESALNLSVGDTPPSFEALQALAAEPMIGQVFGVLVNAASGPANLTTQDVSSIFSGTYGSWEQVPNSGKTGTIVICRREKGSGTQTQAAIFFLGQNCTTAPISFVHSVTNPPATGATVQEFSTGGSLNGCVSGSPNAIGIAVGNDPAGNGTKFVTLDGITMSKANAALGQYREWFEATASFRGSLAGLPLDAARTIKDMASDNDTLPNVNSALALAFVGPSGAENQVVLPPNATRPVAVGRRGGTTGNSCSNPIGQN